MTWAENDLECLAGCDSETNLLFITAFDVLSQLIHSIGKNKEEKKIIEPMTVP